MRYDTFEYFEMNILENEKLISSSADEVYNPKENLEATSASQSIQRSSSAASSTGGGIGGGIGGSVLAIVVVTTLVTITTSFLLSTPIVNVVDFDITHEEIGLTLELEDSDNPYIASILRNNEVMEKVEVSSDGEIIFSNLDYETEYIIIIENDYGIGVSKVKEIEITTASEPIYPNGRLRIDDQSYINYALKELNIYVDISDDYNYLSNYKVEITDEINTLEDSYSDIKNPVVISLESLNRGYLTVTIYADSSHPVGGLKQVLTTYKIYY